MRTNINAIVTNRSVFGFGQDSAVATRNDVTCADAAQHLSPWHAGQYARSLSRAYKRRDLAVVAGTVRKVKPVWLAITGPGREPERVMSLELVMA
jgi:hypothetical protein